jgi:DNA helicase-2/ATP-dependent DNA helicase PcrA
MTAAAEHTDHAAGADSRAAELLTGLNPRQREAVIHTGSPLLIVAGAGSGKTTVLTRRIAYALATGRAHPGEVLAITFTNKAAKEMAERVSSIVGTASRAMWVSTFHSSCVRILRREAKVLGMKSNFTIYDAQDAQRLVAQILKELGLDTKKYAPRAILHRISNLKNELQTPDDFIPRPNNPADEVLADVFKRYTSRLRLANAFDFDDLIAETVHLFGAFPEVADSYRRRFRHILVDEYQDTNPAQYALIKALAGDGAGGPTGAELTVVGDADQSIYAFRGATVRNIVEFEKDFPNADTILLEQNYRSTQNILDAANAVIANNDDRREKKLWTSEGSGEQIVGWVAENEQGEARFIVDRIDDLIDDEKYTYGDFAVFYRTNAQSRAIEDALVRSGIPYKVVGGTRFYERKEIKDALAYLRVVANPDDDVNLRRILNVPKRSIGDRTEGLIADFADRENISFYTALGRLDEIPHLSSRALTSVQKFYDLMQDLRSTAESSPLSRVIEAILEQSGYLESLQKSTDPQDESRVDNLAELVAVAEDFVATREAAAVAEATTPIQTPRKATAAAGATTENETAAEAADPDVDDDGSADASTPPWRRSRRHRPVPRTGGPGLGHGSDPRCRTRSGHADDPAHGQGTGVPGGLPHRTRRRRIPAFAFLRESAGAVRGAASGVCRAHARTAASARHSRRDPEHVGPASVQSAEPVPVRDPGEPHQLGEHGQLLRWFRFGRLRLRRFRLRRLFVRILGRITRLRVFTVVGQQLPLALECELFDTGRRIPQSDPPQS